MDQIAELIELYPDLDELFDVLDITIEDVLEILLLGGHISIPEFLER